MRPVLFICLGAALGGFGFVYLVIGMSSALDLDLGTPGKFCTLFIGACIAAGGAAAGFALSEDAK